MGDAVARAHGVHHILLVEPLQRVGGADAPAVRFGEGQAREALLEMLFEMFGDPGMTLAPPGCQLTSDSQEYLVGESSPVQVNDG